MESNRNIITYQELIDISTTDNGERLMDVREYDSEIVAEYEKLDMLQYTGENIFVRETIAKKLAAANKILRQKNDLRLKVVYGYRHPEVQKKYFKDQRTLIEKNNPKLSGKELDAFTHNFVAAPDVAGHPTGGAVDITIIDSTGGGIDMGTKIADFNQPERIKTFTSDISDKQKANRILLHDLLINQGFAPFYGEWWHFSYGDREWAFFYKEKSAIYSPIDYRI